MKYSKSIYSSDIIQCLRWAGWWLREREGERANEKDGKKERESGGYVFIQRHWASVFFRASYDGITFIQMELSGDTLTAEQEGGRKREELSFKLYYPLKMMIGSRTNDVCVCNLRARISAAYWEISARARGGVYVSGFVWLMVACLFEFHMIRLWMRDSVWDVCWRLRVSNVLTASLWDDCIHPHETRWQGHCVRMHLLICAVTVLGGATGLRHVWQLYALRWHNLWKSPS